VAQEYTLPTSPEALRFRYRVLISPGERQPDVPPDAFLAFLVDPATGERVQDGSNNPVPTNGVPTAGSQAYFYADSDGQVRFDPQFVTTTVDSDGWRSVDLDISSLPPGNPVHLEFGLAATSNGVISTVLLDGEELDLYESAVCGNQNYPNCGVASAADCLWRVPIGGCGTLTDAVEQRLCDMNIRLDGDLSDAIASGASVALDQAHASNRPAPGTNGWSDDPWLEGAPNGFNIAKSVFLYMPDSNAGDGIDDSFIYMAWDIAELANSDGWLPAPFDADHDGCAALAYNPSNELEGNREEYKFYIQSCTNDSTYNATVENPNQIGSPNFQDYVDALRLDDSTTSNGLMNFRLPAGSIISFPTSTYTPPPNPTNRSNGCVDREQFFCARGNNVEVVLKRVESQIDFGQNLDADTRRMRLADSVLLLEAWRVQQAEHDFASILVRNSIPRLEVSKHIRLSGGELVNSTGINDGGNTVFQITLENLGNENLDVAMQDQLTSLNATCSPVCGSLYAELQRGGSSIEITQNNAGQYGLTAAFFSEDCSHLNQGFLGAIRNGQTATVGTLLKRSHSRNTSGACTVTAGDKLVLRFSVHGDVACPGGGGTCLDSISATGTLVGSQSSVADNAAVVDTRTEEGASPAVDNNRASVIVNCP
jgi:hypothetical protein